MNLLLAPLKDIDDMPMAISPLEEVAITHEQPPLLNREIGSKTAKGNTNVQVLKIPFSI